MSLFSPFQCQKASNDCLSPITDKGIWTIRYMKWRTLFCLLCHMSNYVLDVALLLCLGAASINKFQPNITMLCKNKALSFITTNILSECFISVVRYLHFPKICHRHLLFQADHQQHHLVCPPNLGTLWFHFHLIKVWPMQFRCRDERFNTPLWCYTAWHRC